MGETLSTDRLREIVEEFERAVADRTSEQRYSLGAYENPHDKVVAKKRSELIDLLALRASKPEVERAGIYFASKTAHASRWRVLRDKVGFPIISTWIDEAGQGESQDLSDLWQRCISEASGAEVFVLNCEPGEVLKGGWIELGAALSAGVPVLAVGIEEFTVAHDKRIRHFARMADVTAFLKPMVNGVSYVALASLEENRDER